MSGESNGSRVEADLTNGKEILATIEWPNEEPITGRIISASPSGVTLLVTPGRREEKVPQEDQEVVLLIQAMNIPPLRAFLDVVVHDGGMDLVFLKVRFHERSLFLLAYILEEAGLCRPRGCQRDRKDSREF